jgi:Tfp pilus assembly major pilin PilA
MRFLKTGAGRWVVPAVLAAVLASALLITPVIAGTSGISGKKVNKTIAKKTNVTQLTIAGTQNLNTAQTTIGTLNLAAGAYDVRSTFDVRQNATGANISCFLRLNGVGQDQSDTFTGTGTITAQSSVAMEVSGQARAATSASLTCSSSAAANVNHGEITALKVPAVKTVAG